VHAARLHDFALLLTATGVVLAIVAGVRTRRGKPLREGAVFAAALPLVGSATHVLATALVLRVQAERFGLATRPGVAALEVVAPRLLWAAATALLCSVLLMVLAQVRPRPSDAPSAPAGAHPPQARWLAWLLAWAAAGLAALVLGERWIAERIAHAHASAEPLVRDAVAPAAPLRAATLAVLLIGLLALATMLIRSGGRTRRAWIAASTAMGLTAGAAAIPLWPQPELGGRLGAPQHWEGLPPADFQPVGASIFFPRELEAGPPIPNSSLTVLPGRVLLPHGAPCTAPASDLLTDTAMALDRRATVGDLRRAVDCLPSAGLHLVWPVPDAYRADERARLARWYPLLSGLTHERHGAVLHLDRPADDWSPPPHTLTAHLSPSTLLIRYRDRGGPIAHLFSLHATDLKSHLNPTLIGHRQLFPDAQVAPLTAPDDLPAEVLLQVIVPLQRAGLRVALMPAAPEAAPPPHPPLPAHVAHTELIPIRGRTVVLHAPWDLLFAEDAPGDDASREARAHLWSAAADLHACLGDERVRVHVVHGAHVTLTHGDQHRPMALPTEWPDAMGAILADPHRPPCVVPASAGPSALGDLLTQAAAEHFGITSCRHEGLEGVCR
jgi:hypothetical protein